VHMTRHQKLLFLTSPGSASTEIPVPVEHASRISVTRRT
jgi:hypothetical protein